MDTAQGIPRLFSQWYDSVRQRDMLMQLQGGQPFTGLSIAARRMALGQMRWDAIRSPFRLQSSAQLLDGSFFRLLADYRLLADVGIPGSRSEVLPFEVMTIGGSLESSLKEMITRSFYPSSIDGSDRLRQHIQNQLASAVTREEIERRCARDGTAQGVAGIFHDFAGVPPAECAKLAAAWQFWFDCAAAGTLRTREASRLLDDSAALAAEGFLDVPQTALGRRVAHRIVSDATLDPRTGERRRSMVWAEIVPLEASGDSPERLDAQLLKDAFNRGYYRTMARSEGAMLATVPSGQPMRGIRRDVAMRRIDPEQTVVFPLGFIEFLGRLTEAEWQQFLKDVEPHLRRWWASWDVPALQLVGDRLADIGHTRDREDRERRARTAISAFTAVSIGAAGAVVGSGVVGAFLGGSVGLLAWVLTEPLGTAVTRRLQSGWEPFEVVEVFDETSEPTAAR